MTTKFKKGDSVKVAREDTDTDWTFGLTGTVVATTYKRYPNDNLTVLVEFSQEDAQGQGHNDSGGEGHYDLHGPNNRWWVDPKVLDKVEGTLTLGASEVPNTFKAGSKTSSILSHLLQGKSISNLEAQTVYGNWRLSDSIHNIRKAGYDVETVIKTDEAGKEYSSYKLASKHRSTSATPVRLVKAA